MTVMLVMVLGSQKPKAENPDKHIPSQKKVNILHTKRPCHPYKKLP